MPVRKAEAEWQGALQDGEGTMRLGGGAFEGPYSWRSRFQDAPGTNPEELIGAAHAGCFSMALSGVLGEAGHTPERISTSARVHLDKANGGFAIDKIELATRGQVKGISDEDFARFAEEAKANCPVSQALAGVEITVEAELEQ